MITATIPPLMRRSNRVCELESSDSALKALTFRLRALLIACEGNIAIRFMEPISSRETAFS